MPLTVGATTCSSLKQKTGRSPPHKPNPKVALKLLKYNRIPQFTPAAGRQIAGQLDRAVAQSHESAHRVPKRLEEAPHLAVAPFLQHHSVPAVAAFALPVLDNPLKARRLPVELDAGK